MISRRPTLLNPLHSFSSKNLTGQAPTHADKTDSALNLDNYHLIDFLETINSYSATALDSSSANFSFSKTSSALIARMQSY